MNGLARFVGCSILLSVCSIPALADSVSVTGNVSFDQSTLTFAPPFATTADSGIFSRFGNGTVAYYLGTVPYNVGVPSTELLFTISNADGDVLSFFDQSNTPTNSVDGNGNLDVALHEVGYYTFNGGMGYAGSFDLNLLGTSATGAASPVAFLGTGALLDSTVVDPLGAASVTPEPTSILFLGTGLLGMAGLLRVKTRRDSM